MGKTTKPLVIWTDADWCGHAAMSVLATQGHTIRALSEPLPDLILSRAAWWWSDEMWDYLDVALKATRARRYSKKAKDAAKDNSGNGAHD